MTRKKTETPEAGKEEPKTSVGAKLMLDRINQLQADHDALLKDNQEMAQCAFELMKNHTDAMEILSEFTFLDINIFSPKYYREFASLQLRAANHIVNTYLETKTLEGKF